MSDKCEFPGCALETVFGSQDYCIFHSPVGKKGINQVEFNEQIKLKIKNGDFNFTGYVFPYFMDFFELCQKEKQLQGNWIFSRAIFHSGASFRELHFKEAVLFDNTHFINGRISFTSTKFNDGVSFVGTSFENSMVFFIATEFMGQRARFTRAHFGDDVLFGSNKIGCPFDFIDINLGQNARFYFRKPEFIIKEYPVTITFERTKFNPYAAHFENIRFDGDLEKTELSDIPVFIFRYCALKDVFFVHNDMSIFSFLDNAYFEEAIYSSNNWYSYKRRKNLIFEDIFFNKLKQSITNNSVLYMKEDLYSVEELKSYHQVSQLYLWLKKSTDMARDYQLASWFYFNEFEMKRKSLLETKKLRKVLSIFLPSKLWIYSLYKLFAGYGEKPFWSFVWFGIFTLGFSFLHLFNGIKTSNGLFNYDWGLPFPGWREFLRDFGYSLFFTLYRVIPISYLPYERDKYGLLDNGISDLALSFFNTVILIILIIFIGVGLKRHFRRF